MKYFYLILIKLSKLIFKEINKKMSYKNNKTDSQNMFKIRILF